MSNREDIVLAAYQSTPQAPDESKRDWEARVANKAIELTMALNNTEHSPVFQALGNLEAALHDKNTFSATIVKMRWEESRRRVKLLLFSQKNVENEYTGTDYVNGQPITLPVGYETLVSPTVWDNRELVDFLRENAEKLVGQQVFFVKHLEQYRVNGKTQKTRSFIYMSPLKRDEDFEQVPSESCLGGVMAKPKQAS